MRNQFKFFIAIMIVGSILLGGLSSACNPFGSKTVVVSIYYGSEKQEWLEPLVQEYNEAKHKTANGSTIVVQSTPMGSIESVNAIIEGQIQPIVWSPASDIYVPVANAEWRKSHSEDLVTGSPDYLVLSPVIIAMWEPMARTLGWPDQFLGWADVARMSIAEEGWSTYGYPEWGNFKFGHTDPGRSNSGIVAIIAQAYAGAGKQRDLAVEDVQNPSVASFMSDVQRSIIHYGTSTGFFAERMFDRGPSYLSAAVMYENLIVAQEEKRLQGATTQLPVVAIYPREGTFWSNHPYIILNASWVTDEQREAAEDFKAFLLDKPQQLRAIGFGFRPADTSIPFGEPLDVQHGVDPAQPQTVLEVPSAPVIEAIEDVWLETKKPVDLLVVTDISGSMKGEKIASARNSMIQFINMLDDRDRLQIMLFNTSITTLTPLKPVGEIRNDMVRRISGIAEGGGTSLYDVTIEAYQALQDQGSEEHIRAVVILSDGRDENSIQSLDQLMSKIGGSEGEGGAAIKLFTIAFGEGADKTVLKQMAESTGGKQYESTPEDIIRVYGEIATFF